MRLGRFTIPVRSVMAGIHADVAPLGVPVRVLCFAVLAFLIDLSICLIKNELNKKRLLNPDIWTSQ